jgi:hypothetical protein
MPGGDSCITAQKINGVTKSFCQTIGTFLPTQMNNIQAIPTLQYAIKALVNTKLCLIYTYL